MDLEVIDLRLELPIYNLSTSMVFAGSFIETLIEAHAAQCQMHQRTPATALQNRQHEHSQLTSSGESCNYDDTVATSGGVYMNNADESDCPICGISFPLELLPMHADSCADFIL